MATIEEKAKRYDEAIEIAKEINNEHRAQPFNVMTRVFPELKESNGERIRKWLIYYFKEVCDNVSEKEKKSVLAWLEKQGNQETLCDKCRKEHPSHSCQDITALGRCSVEHEQKPVNKVEPKFKVKYAGSEYNVLKVKDIAGVTYYGIEDEPNHIDYIKADNCEIISGYGIKENGSPYPTKPAVFSGQKPADKVRPKFKVGDVVKHKDNPHLTYILKRFTDDGDYEFHAIGKDGNEGCTCFAVVKYQDEWELVEQNTTWNEEDEIRLKHILRLLDVKDDKKYLLMFGLNSLQDLEKDIDWLKSLKDRVQPQPKQEWSKEDERNLNIVSSVINNPSVQGIYDYHKVNPTDVSNWLKERIRQHKQWKPSDEQLKALNTMNVTGCITEVGQGKSLVELYNDLKKLREK